MTMNHHSYQPLRISAFSSVEETYDNNELLLYYCRMLLQLQMCTAIQVQMLRNVVTAEHCQLT
jgi:hypothetical protein